MDCSTALDNQFSLTTAVSMLHECRRLLWMTPSRWEHIVGVWPGWTCCTVVDASVFRRHCRILRRSIWCINHNISDCRCDMQIVLPPKMNDFNQLFCPSFEQYLSLFFVLFKTQLYAIKQYGDQFKTLMVHNIPHPSKGAVKVSHVKLSPLSDSV